MTFLGCTVGHTRALRFHSRLDPGRAVPHLHCSLAETKRGSKPEASPMSTTYIAVGPMFFWPRRLKVPRQLEREAGYGKFPICLGQINRYFPLSHSTAALKTLRTDVRPLSWRWVPHFVR